MGESKVGIITKICDCPFNKGCAEIRQLIQCKDREENHTSIRDCVFYRELVSLWNMSVLE